MTNIKHLSAMVGRLMIALSIVLALPVLASEKTSDAEILMGSISLDAPVNMIGRLAPLAKYLSEKVGSNVIFRPSSTFGNTIDDLGNNVIQIAYLTPAAYLEAREKYGVIPLVKPLNKGKNTFTLKIFVKKESAIKNVSQLQGKTFAFGDKKSKLQQVVVENAGIRLNEFSAYRYLLHQDNVVKAIIHGDFDAGIVKDTVLEKFSNGGLRVVHTSDPFVAFIFAVSKDFSPQVASRLKRALLELKSTSARETEILTSLEKGYTGFESVNDKEFDGIRKLLANSEKVPD